MSPERDHVANIYLGELSVGRNLVHVGTMLGSILATSCAMLETSSDPLGDMLGHLGNMLGPSRAEQKKRKPEEHLDWGYFRWDQM